MAQPKLAATDAKTWSGDFLGGGGSGARFFAALRMTGNRNSNGYGNGYGNSNGYGYGNSNG
jgi:hypothetical protein